MFRAAREGDEVTVLALFYSENVGFETIEFLGRNGCLITIEKLRKRIKQFFQVIKHLVQGSAFQSIHQRGCIHQEYQAKQP
jgi:hypothetical protein